MKSGAVQSMYVYPSNMPMSLNHMFVVQGEITALRGDVAHLFLALKAAESRHQQELAGVIIDAAQHQTKVSISCSWVSPQQAPIMITTMRNCPFLSSSLHSPFPPFSFFSFPCFPFPSFAQFLSISVQCILLKGSVQCLLLQAANCA